MSTGDRICSHGLWLQNCARCNTLGEVMKQYPQSVVFPESWEIIKSDDLLPDKWEKTKEVIWAPI